VFPVRRALPGIDRLILAFLAARLGRR
jgi:hypothetical protein